MGEPKSDHRGKTIFPDPAGKPSSEEFFRPPKSRDFSPAGILAKMTLFCWGGRKGPPALAALGADVFSTSGATSPALQASAASDGDGPAGF